MAKSVKKNNIKIKPNNVALQTPIIKTISENMWDEIKNLKLSMFALPSQLISVYYKPINVDPNKLFLVALTQATATLPALENAISEKYLVEQIDRFTVITLKK